MQERGFVILDFGSQLTQLIARRLRELQYYSEILPFDTSLAELKKRNPYGIILSGGPNSVYEKGSPLREVKELIDLAPVMGICYGMQLLSYKLGGEVKASSHREYGYNIISWEAPIAGLTQKQKVWMSHGDIVEKIPPGFKLLAQSEGKHPAVMLGERVLGLQFHPEVAHTEQGELLLKYFAEKMCHAKDEWTAPHMAEMLMNQVKQQVGSQDHILCGLSGGVDSTVAATLLTKVFGKERVHCVFVNNGLLRKNEYADVLKNYQGLGLNVRGVDATREFLSALKGLVDPEQKRKAIGRTFIEVFEKSIDKAYPIKWLAQGTLYPDVIESISPHKGGASHTIKSHHNVGGLPEKMNLGLVEPLRELFKDEVRKLGHELGLSEQLLWRHPFPGPGLGIRIIGEITEESLKIVQEADHIFISKLYEKNLYHKIWQAFCVLLPVKTVGVMGDGRTYEKTLALRAVTSSDGMTADWYPFEFEFLREVSNEITNKVKGVNRVVYDITSKPPGTIEWE